MRLLTLAAALTLTAASAALAASGTVGGGASQRLDARTRQAVLGLYGLDSQLQAWRQRVASLEARAALLERERAALRQGLDADRSSLETGRHELALELRGLYERGSVDPVAVVLGAASLTKGLRQLDDLSRVANESRQIVNATVSARRRLLRSRHLLAAKERRLEVSLAAARAAEQRLAGAVASRRSYISSLRAQLRAAQVQSVEATANAVQQKSQQLQPRSPAPVGRHSLVVSATCYDLSGTTATGMPVGHGVVAVDPSVIPLGTRMYIPGYGNGVAADVGGAIKGDIIDLWMTPGECAAWGRRTVTITLY